MTSTLNTPGAAVRTALTPYICVKDAPAAIAFYLAAFGATESPGRMTEPGGRVGHAEVTIDGVPIMLADEHPEIGVLSPQTLGGSSVSLHLIVANVDALAARAVAAGATLLRPVTDQVYGQRSCKLADPFGHTWMLATPIEAVSSEELQRRVAGHYTVA